MGDWGRERLRHNIGRRTVAGHDVTEEALFGSDRDVPTQPTTEWEFPSSSRVKAYQYDFNTQQLRVRFLKYNTPWVYDNVPTTVFQAFDAAPSKGMYINSTLNYMEHRKASPAEEAAFFTNV